MPSFFREPTQEEKKDFVNIMTSKKSGKDVFMEELGKQEQIATKKGIPFARVVAKSDYKEHFKNQIALSLKKNGFLDPNDITKPNVNWEQYSDLKNFELVEESETPDEHLSRMNPGLNVMVAYKVYQFKRDGITYYNKYTIMESRESAILRAKQKQKALDKELGV